jgi:FkbM family methyltransferase
MKKKGILLHWTRLKRSLSKHYHELRLPSGYKRLGTKYGGWWIDTKLLSSDPLLIDCGLGEDISFPIEFSKLFPFSQIIGIEPNPRSLKYCYNNIPSNMKIIEKAFWYKNNQDIIFHLPRSQEDLPDGADGVSGSIHQSHEYVIEGENLQVKTIDLDRILLKIKRTKCDILKMDIEGAEYEVLKELTQHCNLKKVRQLLIEFHHHATHHTINDTEKSIALIKSCGYKLIHIEDRNYKVRPNFRTAT